MSNTKTALEKRATKITSRAWRNPALVYLASLQTTGRRAIYGRLKQIVRLDSDQATVETFDWTSLRYEHVAAIRARFIEIGQAPATINLALAALRGVALASWNLGLISAEDYERIKHVPSVRGERLAPGRALDRGEVSALLDACSRDDSPAGRRDAAIIALLFAAGLRRSEAASVRVEDYDRATGELRVIGKGDKQRTVWLTNGAVAAIEDWLNVRGTEAGPMLVALYKGGRMRTSGDRAMYDTAIYNALQKRAREAKVKSFSPHDGRRSFISDLLDAGADITAVQNLAGHASPVTTARYDRRGEAAKRRAAGLIHLPYRSRTA